MNEARAALEEFVKTYGANAGYAVRFPHLVDALVKETRAQALADADAYLTRHGYGDSAYLLRSTDVPVQS